MAGKVDSGEAGAFPQALGTMALGTGVSIGTCPSGTVSVVFELLPTRGFHMKARPFSEGSPSPGGARRAE